MVRIVGRRSSTIFLPRSSASTLAYQPPPKKLFSYSADILSFIETYSLFIRHINSSETSLKILGLEEQKVFQKGKSAPRFPSVLNAVAGRKFPLARKRQGTSFCRGFPLCFTYKCLIAGSIPTTKSWQKQKAFQTSARA